MLLLVSGAFILLLIRVLIERDDGKKEILWKAFLKI